MLQTLIIDDETHIRNTLVMMLTKFCPQVEVSGEADSVKSGMDAIRTQHPDVVFLDIHLPDGDGFDLLHALEKIDFRVVFISSFNNKSIQAFRRSGLTFLQKPFNLIDLRNAVNDAKQPALKDFRQQLRVLEHDLAIEK
jgi:two-component system, LytTR family, response regulator